MKLTTLFTRLFPPRPPAEALDRWELEGGRQIDAGPLSAVQRRGGVTLRDVFTVLTSAPRWILTSLAGKRVPHGRPHGARHLAE